MQRELEVLSDQHTKKCLENSELSQELQNERESVTQCKKENQELKEMQVETSSFHCRFIIFPKPFFSSQESGKRKHSGFLKK